jgi:hypothetical protein
MWEENQRTRNGLGALVQASSTSVDVGLDSSREVLLVLQDLGLDTLKRLCCLHTYGDMSIHAWAGDGVI